MRFLYHLFIYFYQFAISLASHFNPKAKLWIEGRKDWPTNLKAAVPSNKNVVWFHCASLGEFEQGRQLIESYKSKFPNDFILLTFFSPSGYEIRKNYSTADYVAYMPLDNPKNAALFIQIVQPSKVFFIKYEFWFNYLTELGKNNIDTYLVSGIFRKNQQFFKWYGTWYKKQLKNFTHFFLQDKNSAKLLSSINYQNFDVCGDTRFDRVKTIISSAKKLNTLNEYAKQKPTIIVGSSWLKDEKLFANFIQNKDIQLIIAPHEVNPRRINELKEIFKESFSLLSNFDLTKKVLIIDSIGILSSLYQYGKWAYIGGGFGKGIHNTLEAAAYGKPILFGPNFYKFQEAKDLIALGVAKSIKTQEELNKIAWRLLTEEKEVKDMGEAALSYVNSKIGATDFIINFIENNKETTTD